MGIARRMKTIIQANLNEAVGLVEDPEKIIKQSIRDMEEGLRRARAQVVACVACEKRIEGRLASLEAQAAALDEGARAAVARGADEAARKAITERNRARREAQRLAGEIARQRRVTDGLRGSLKELDGRVADMKRRKDTLVARKVQARARKQIHSSLIGIAEGRVFVETAAVEAFDRMEDKIAEAEAESEAVADLSREVATDSDATVDEARRACADPVVEEEIAALKAVLGKKDE